MGSSVSGKWFAAMRAGRVVGRHVTRIVVVGLLLAVGMPGSAAAATSWTAYVTNYNSDTVTPIDMATNTAGTPITVGDDPFAVAITPDGKTAYVANDGSTTVTPIDIATNTAGTAISVGNVPDAVAITPDGRTAYVANAGSNNVTPIDIATNTAGTAIPVGAEPDAIAITPDGKTAYVANSGGATVTPIDIATNTAGTAIPVGTEPEAIAITPDGKTAYVANQTNNNVTPIDIAANTAGTAIPVGTYPQAIAITPDGKTAYVANAGGATVTPIDVATNTAETAIPAGNGPSGVAITPDGKTAYVSNQTTKSVTLIDIATNTAGTAIPVGDFPVGIAIVPDQAPVASFSVIAGRAGSPSVFDASGSVSAVGAIVSYRWSFGDGQTAMTTVPHTSHVYARTGSYTATLTVTNSAGTSLTQVFTGQTVSNNGGPAAMTSHTVTVAATQSTTAKFDSQQITLLTPSLQTCTTASSALRVRLTSTAIPKSHSAKLKFSSAAFYIGKGVKHTTKKIEHLKHGKTKKITITTWTPNATVHHLPAVLALKLPSLKTSSATLKVVISYKKTVTKHGHKRTETVTKTLTTKLNIC